MIININDKQIPVDVDHHSALRDIEAESRIYAQTQVLVGSDNGLSPVRRQAIIWIMLDYC